MTGIHQVLASGMRRKTPVLATFTTGAQNNADGLSITKPSGVVSGDLLLIVEAHATNGATATPSGFTPLVSQGQGVFPAICMHVWYRQADGTEGATFTSDLPGSALDAVWLCGRFNERALSVAPEGTIAGGSSAAPDSPNVAPSWGLGAQSLILAVTAWNDETTVLSSYPPNYLDNQIVVAGAGVGLSLGLATFNTFTAAEDPASWAISASEIWQAATVAIKSV